MENEDKIFEAEIRRYMLMTDIIDALVFCSVMFVLSMIILFS
jgi:hypothetical protein